MQDYTKFANQPVVEKKVEHVVEEPEKIVPEVETVEESLKFVTGIVTDCTKLNVREAPNSNAEVVCKIDCKSDVIIDEAESTDDFYKVCTAAGVEGFCMKRFITIMP